MRYGALERALEGSVKRRRVPAAAAMVDISSSAAAAAANFDTRAAVADDAHVGEAASFDLEILDCAICTEPLAAPIYQCENGHIACASCSKLTNLVCPSCKKPTGSIRNLAMEKLIESLKVKCTFLGCPDMVKFSDKLHHERLCTFAPLSCPFPECNQFQGRYESLQEHVKENHPANWDALTHHTEVVFPMRVQDRFHLLFDSALYFVVHRSRSSIGDMCYLTLPKVLSARYGTAVHYRMEIRYADGATFKVDAQCSTEDFNGTPRQGFVVIPDDRSVDISVSFLPQRPPPRLLGSRWRAPEETVTLL